MSVSRMLKIGKASVYLKMRDGETQDEAVDRLLGMLNDADVELCAWGEESVEEYDDDEA